MLRWRFFSWGGDYGTNSQKVMLDFMLFDKSDKPVFPRFETQPVQDDMKLPGGPQICVRSWKS